MWEHRPYPTLADCHYNGWQMWISNPCWTSVKVNSQATKDLLSFFWTAPVLKPVFKPTYPQTYQSAKKCCVQKKSQVLRCLKFMPKVMEIVSWKRKWTPAKIIQQSFDCKEGTIVLQAMGKSSPKNTHTHTLRSRLVKGQQKGKNIPATETRIES